MATAPRPGVGKRKEQAEQAKRVLKLTIKGESRTLAPAALSMKERGIVRKATGLPFEAFVGDEQAFGIDSLMVIWWLAGRANGDPFLTLTQVEEDWPDDLEDGDIEMSEVTPDGSDIGDDTDPQS